MYEDFTLRPLRPCFAGAVPYLGREVVLTGTRPGGTVRGPLVFDGLFRIGDRATGCDELFTAGIFQDTGDPVADRFYPALHGCRVYGDHGTVTIDGAGFVTGYGENIGTDDESYRDIVRFDAVQMFESFAAGSGCTPGCISFADIVTCGYWTDRGLYEPPVDTREGDDSEHKNR